jgi:hypothetical protein
MLGTAVVLAIIAAYRRQFAAALLLLGAAALSAHTVRLIAFLGIAVAIVGTTVLDGLWPSRNRFRSSDMPPMAGATVLVVGLAYIRLSASLDQGVPITAGLSPQIPERAAAFIEREHLPSEIITLEYAAFQVWRLPQYKDYFDARTLPFGLAAFARLRQLAASPPGPLWDREADRYGINVVLAWTEVGPLILN